MRQLTQGVNLIHKLRQLRRTEEFFNRRGNRANVNQRLRRNHIQILDRHTLADNTLHSGKSDTELVLQKLTHAAQTAVAQMVDIVHCADAARQVSDIGNGGDNIVNQDMARNQLIPAQTQLLFEFIRLHIRVLL